MQIPHNQQAQQPNLAAHNSKIYGIETSQHDPKSQELYAAKAPAMT
jgi:hypothetical protein